MLVYWAACICSVVFAMFGLKVAHKRTNTAYYLKLSFFSALPLIFIASIRYGVGQDYLYTYVPYFLRLQRGIIHQKLEPLYHLINVIVIRMHGDYPWVFTICAILFLTLVFYRIFTDSPYPLLSIYLLVAMTYYFIFLNTMRQMVGCAILLMSLPYSREKKFWKFAAVVGIASLFHSSCCLFIFTYWLPDWHIRPKWIAVITVCIFIFGQAFGSLINRLVQLTSYSIYQGSRFDNGQQGWIVLALNIVLVLFTSICYSDEPRYTQYYNLQVIALWIASLTGKVALISRIRWMFGIQAIILIPMAIRNVRKRSNRILLSLLIIFLYFLYTSYTIGVKNGNNVLPYRTFFSI